jgi:EmrB/QacA subfamily drug resistance transporter
MTSAPVTSAPVPEISTAERESRRITVIALIIVLLLGALDQTIVSTAMPRIVAQLKGLAIYSWVTTVYLLSSTVMVPIWGKLGDLYGRKKVLIWGVSIFIVGSALCGMSGEIAQLPLLGGGMTQLIVFRGLQGIGGGALFTSAFAVIADLFPPRERGKMSGYFGGVFALASIVGPLIGGFFTEHGTVHLGGWTIAGWRWVFYVNLPLSALALFMIIARTPGLKAGRGGKIDILGAALVVTAFVPLLLALTWGGHLYAWSSPQVLGLLLVTAVSLVAFYMVERRVAEPILPLDLFGNKVFSLTNAAAFVISMAFFGAITFLPLYLQLGIGVSATQSGMIMLPMMFGLILSSTISGRLVTTLGRYKPMMLFGAVMMMIGILLMTQLGPETRPWWGVAPRVFILGIGLGPAQGLFALAAQNAVPPARIGVATSSSQFFRQIGSTVGVAVFGAVMTHALAAESAKLGGGGGALSLDQLQKIALAQTQSGLGARSMAVDPLLRTAFSRAIVDLFWAAGAIAVLGLIAIVLIPELPLRSHHHVEPVAEPGEQFEREEEEVAAGA